MNRIRKMLAVAALALVGLGSASIFGVAHAGNPGWYSGSSGYQYHNDPSGHYDGGWSK
jgi:phage-related minor tail protein